MCLAFLVHRMIPEAPVILLFNRDEDFARVSLPIHAWRDDPRIFGGFDQATGGTWAGIRRDGRFAMLTFVREPRLKRTPAKRRGGIVREYLAEETSPHIFAERLRREREGYLGYNLVFGDLTGAFHYNNRSDRFGEAGAGVFGVSNADFETPWFKVVRGKSKIVEALSRPAFTSVELFSILEDRAMAPAGEVQITGLPAEREATKSPMFVCEPNYGTRSSSVAFIGPSGIQFTERSYGPWQKRSAEVEIRTCEG